MRAGVDFEQVDPRLPRTVAAVSLGWGSGQSSDGLIAMGQTLEPHNNDPSSHFTTLVAHRLSESYLANY